MYHYWGKASPKDSTCHLLVYHCLDVGAVLRCLLDADDLLRKRLHSLAPALQPADLDALLLSFAVLHDLGKFAPSFQQMRQDVVTLLGGPSMPLHNRAHHTHQGKAMFLLREIRQAWPAFRCQNGYEPMDILRPLADAAFGHHGKPPQSGIGNLYLPPETQNALAAFMGTVAALFLPDGVPLPEGDDAETAFAPVSWLFAGLVVLADWIASGASFPYVAKPLPLADYWRGQALPLARKAVVACGVLPPPCRKKGGFHELLPHIPRDREATPLQEYAMRTAGRGTGPRLFLFEDVTGAGKTEAALLAAHGLMAAGEAEGFYVALPTMATANGMYARLAAAYRALFEADDDAAPSLLLAHGARGIHDAFVRSIALERPHPSVADTDEDRESRESGAFCASWLADNRKKALLAPCGVGTLDQALLSVLPAKHQCLRLLGLGRSVLVADEVHAYDTYTTGLLERLLTFHAGLGGSAILLSATLPRAVKQKLAAAFCRGAGFQTPELTDAPLPLATRIAADGCAETGLAATRRIVVRLRLTDDVAAAFARLVAVHEAGGCAILVCNTVDRAVAARAALAAMLPADDVLLFHARFALCDRLAIEERVLSLFGKPSTRETRRGKILVATQVIEQSLDIDGDYLVTELAPMELVLQRLGREQRHERKWRPAGFTAPELCILAPRAVDAPEADWGKAELGKGLFVYPARGLLWRTARLLEARERIELPRDARELVEGAYDEESRPTPKALAASEDAKAGADWARGSLAEANALLFEPGYCGDAADGGWYDDRIVPTRLGEPTVTLRLVRVLGDALELWAGPGHDAAMCARSEVSAPAWRVADIAPDAGWEERLGAFAETLPDKARWSRLMPFAPTTTPGEWRCVLPGAQLTYTMARGLSYDDL